MIQEQNCRVLVTGGAGYVGSHACKSLSQAGFTPISFDNLEHGHISAVNWGPLHQGDLRKAEEIEDAMEEWSPIAVMHFAAYAYVGESVTDPAKYYLNNVTGTLNLLAAMRKAKCENIVFSSSCATYGIPAELGVINERTIQQPVSPYGSSKLMAEKIIIDHCGAYGMRSVLLRYFNAAGADPDGEIGEAHDPETHLIPLLLLAAMDPSRTVELYGDDYPTSDGTCIRDYIHVSDLGRAHVAALQQILETKESNTYNLGTGVGHSVNEVVQGIREITNKPIQTRTIARRAGDPPMLVADISKVKQNLAWEPLHSQLSEIIETAWRWHQQNNPITRS